MSFSRWTVDRMASKRLFKSIPDICFIENTIEAALGLFGDANVLVRMKVSWSLANITDVVVMNT